ncbi:2023_t:CDS:10 [Entrophospora sp. SA101]|nr:2023_t:CDS:10 [Entrophospora sp. SA101]
MFFTTEDQQENQIFIDQLQETSNSEKGKEHEKVTRPLDVEDDHSYKRQHKDEELSDPFEVLFDEEPSVEWEFDTPKPSWLDKIAHKRDSLIYNAFNCNDKRIQYELSLEPIWWKIIDLSDSKITTIITEYELSEINEKFSSLLEDWTTVEPAPESLLQSLEKLDNDQLRTIGEIVRPKGTYGAILELQKLLENKKEQKAPELNNLFGDEKDSNEIDKHKEISPLTVDDHTNSDVAFILDLIRFTGEVVSRASRNRRADAIDAPSNTEGYHLDWMFMCTGSKIEDTSKVFSNTLKVQKTLRDMHQNLIKVIFAEGGGTLSKLVLQASGFYASMNLADFYIPTKYQELELIIKISRVMLQTKKLLSVTISQFKQMKSRAEREKFAPGKVAMPVRQQECRSFQKPRALKTKDYQEPDEGSVFDIV